MDRSDKQQLKRDLDQRVSRANEEVRSPKREPVDRDAAVLATAVPVTDAAEANTSRKE